MKLKELISKIDKSPSNEVEVDIGGIASDAFDIYDINSWIEQDRLMAYWICNWYCTDTWVGMQAYFFDSEFVAIRSHMARKSDRTYEWVSEQAYLKVKEYIQTFVGEPAPDIPLLNMEKDFGDGYKIHYASQVLPHLRASLDGEPVKIVDNEKQGKLDYSNLRKISIIADGKKETIDVDCLQFSYFVRGAAYYNCKRIPVVGEEVYVEKIGGKAKIDAIRVETSGNESCLMVSIENNSEWAFNWTFLEMEQEKLKEG